MLVLTLAILTAASPSTQSATSDDLLLEIEGTFPAAKKWFGMVADLQWDRDEMGTLSPRMEGLKSRFVLKEDPAGQTLSARLPAIASGPHEVFLPSVPGLTVRTQELGAKQVPAEILRGVVVYRGAVAGGDLLYKLTPTHVDEYLYLREPPVTLRREFEFDHGSGVAWLREAGRLIEVIAKDGTARLRLGAPVARGADGTRRTGTIRLVGRKLIAELDLQGLAAPVLVDPDWTTTGTMTVAHWADYGYRRKDGAVMAAAGCALASCPLGLATSACNQILSTTDVWTAGSGVWTAGPSLNVGRYSYAGVQLPNGEGLAAGGCTTTGCLNLTASTERYDDAQARWLPLGSLPHAVGNVTGAELDGGALVVGGCDTSACYADATRFTRATDEWAPVAPLGAPRGYHTTTALKDGRVLVLGGCADPACATVLDDAELYDPSTNTWKAAGVMTSPRAGHTATLLDDGSVLVTGGCRTQPCRGTTLATTETWKADAVRGGVFTAGPMMNAPRHHHTATRLASGQILIAGGADGVDATRSASDVYLPLARRFIQAPRMMMTRAYHVAVPLTSGNVLVGGGCNPATCLPWAEVFSPDGLPIETGDGGVTYDAGTDPVEPPFDAGQPFIVKGGPHPKLYRDGVVSCSTDELQGQPCPLAGWPAQGGDFQPNTRPMVPINGGADVRDDVTGLVWHVPDDGKLYTQAEAVTACGQLATDDAPAGTWRLPNVVELMTINHYGKLAPSVDQAFAAHTKFDNYWTSTPMAGSTMLGWTLKFDAGEVVPLLKDTPLPIRCVRGDFKAGKAPEGHLRLAGPLTVGASGATVTDDANGLEWQRRDDGVKRTWRQSLEYCAHLDLDGHDDWHLPNTFELLSIVEYNSNEAVKLDPVFQEGKGDIYWTGSFGEGLPTLDWGVTFNLGVIDGVTYSGRAYARCARHMATPTPEKPKTCGCSATEAGGIVTLLAVAQWLRRRRTR